MTSRMLASVLLLALAAAPVSAATQVLLPSQPGDMVPASLQARNPVAATGLAVPPSQVHVEHAPISVSWALPHDSALQPLPQPFARSSREYWMDVAASDLRKGVQLPLSAPGAIIRVSPEDPGNGSLDPASMQLRLGRQSLALDRATRQIADVASLHAAGMDVPRASLVLQLKPELGAGLATLQAPTASGRYVVHVFEPQSSTTVTALADRDDQLLGGNVHVRVAMQDGDAPVALTAAGGFLRAPDGDTTLLRFRRQTDGSFAVDAQPNHTSAVAGLWEVHSFTLGTDRSGQEVRRDTTTVFAAATPDARLGGVAAVVRAADHGLDIGLDVSARNASRFAVSGVLYGRGEGGTMVPAAYAQSAAWLEPGNGRLVLHYDAASLVGIAAPYELRDLRLQDQPAIGLLERRALALRFDAP